MHFTEPLPAPASVRFGCRSAAMEPHPVHPWRMNLLPAELSAAPSSPTHSAASPSQKGTHGSLTSKQKIRYIWAFISFPLGCSAERLFVFKSLGVTSGWFCLQYERVHWTTLTFCWSSGPSPGTSIPENAQNTSRREIFGFVQAMIS